MGLFRRSNDDSNDDGCTDDGNDDGCTGHHYGDYSISWKHSELVGCVKGEVDGELVTFLTIRVKRHAKCQHDGCRKRKSKSGDIVYIPEVALSHSGDSARDVERKLRGEE